MLSLKDLDIDIDRCKEAENTSSNVRRTANKSSLNTINRKNVQGKPETPKNIEILKDALEYIPPEDYEVWRNVIWSIKAHDWSIGSKLAHEWSAKSSKYDADTMDSIWAKGKNADDENKIGVDTVYYHAKENGWKSVDVPEWVEELNQQFFVATVGGKEARLMVCQEYQNAEFNGRKSLRYIKDTDFKKTYLNKTIDVKSPNGEIKQISKGDAWLKHPHRREYDQVVFMPEGTEDANVYNTYRGWGVTPRTITSKEDSQELLQSCTRIRRFIIDVICGGDKKIYQYLFDWLTCAVQNLKEPLGVAVVLCGGQGTGKGTFGRLLCKIFGEHAQHFTNSNLLVGEFSGHLNECLFVFADESFSTADKKAEGILKGFITEPELTINAKNITAYSIKNRLRVVMASNADFVISAGQDERRFLVLNVSNAYKQNKEYFAALNHEINNGGAEALLSLLLMRTADMTKIRLVPKTRGLTDQKVNNLSGIDKYIYHCLSAGEIPICKGMSRALEWRNDDTTFVLTSVMQNSCAEFLNSNRQNVSDIPRQLGKRLNQVGVVKERDQNKKGQETKCQGKRRYRYTLVPLEEARKQFAIKRLGDSTFEWD